MGVEIAVPLALFCSVALIFIFAFYFGQRKQAEVQQTIRKAVENGSQLTPDLVRSIGAPKMPHNTDLRRGIILIAIAVAIALFGWSVSYYDDEGMMAMLGIAAFPGLVGLAYLGFHFLTPPQDRDAA